MNRLWFCILLSLFWLAPAANALAAETACAKVVMEIVQELTLERVAFDAKLVLTNNLLSKDLTGVRVDVEIEDGEGNRLDDIFFVQSPTTSNISDVSGSGVVKAGTRAEVHWLIIPSPGAGGIDAAGVYYFVGANLTYTVADKEEIIPIFPDRILVKPMPELFLDYFSPYQVTGDNPFTAEVEPPVPFPLAVRIMNDGFGPANELKIDSAQPKIVENDQGLLIDFKLLNSAVNDGEVEPTLTVDIGNLASKSGATAYWEMISTMTGRFAEFDVSFSHASELGGELTSLIKETNAHYLVHRVRVNLPGRDDILDYLAFDVAADYNPTDAMALPYPDVIFESEYPNGLTGLVDARAEVTTVDPLNPPDVPTATKSEVDLELELTANPPGWIYVRLNDPSQGLLELLDVVRSDGVSLDPHNFWVDHKLDGDFQPVYLLQFIDYRGENGGTPNGYTLVYKKPDVDLTAPVTTLIFDGPASEGETNFITPETRIVFSASDNEGGSGVEGMYRKVVETDSDFIAALPFNLAEAGDYTLEYYSVDRSGNDEEPVNTVSIIVDNAAPHVTAFASSVASFSPEAPAGVSTDRTVSFLLTATDEVPELLVTLYVADAGGNVVRTIEGVTASATELSLIWDGRDDDGNFVPADTYNVQAEVSDGLDTETVSHTAVSEVITVEVSDWFTGTAVDSAAGDQLYPEAAAGRIVWQDRRDGDWNIYLKDADGTVTRLTADTTDQERPAIDSSLVVWQDMRGGDWDIYGYGLDGSGEQVLVAVAGDQQQPVVAGEWLAWQDNRNGNWDIYAKNLVTGEVKQITSHERDQVNPSLNGATLVWEDYRHGLGDIYKYDLAGASETRLTVDVANQTRPVVFGETVVWADQRDGQKEIYRRGGGGEPQRLTYGTGDRTQASLSGGLLVYTDYTAGMNDPNLNFLNLAGGGGRLSSNPARQEEAAVADGLVVWQDDRDGRWQIYMAELEVVPLPIEVDIRPGLNLVGVGQLLVGEYTTGNNLVASTPEGLVIDKALRYDSTAAQFSETGSGGVDFDLSVGSALHLYSESTGTLRVAAGDEAVAYNLQVGVNQIGLLNVPFGYRVHDLIRSVGLENVISVRRFDNSTGLWQSVAVREGEAGPEIVGNNFDLLSGDGVIITMGNQVDAWKP